MRKTIILLALLALPAAARAQGAGCSYTGGGWLLEKPKVNATGPQFTGCIQRTFEALSSSVPLNSVTSTATAYALYVNDVHAIRAAGGISISSAVTLVGSSLTATQVQASTLTATQSLISGQENIGSSLTVRGNMGLVSAGNNPTITITGQYNPTLKFVETGASGKTWSFQGSNDAIGDIALLDASSNRKILITPGGVIQLNPGGGNVGIGTTNPLSALHVNGALAVGTGASLGAGRAFVLDNSAAGGYGIIVNQTGDGATGIYSDSYGTGNVALQTNRGNVLLGTTSGSVGIGTTDTTIAKTNIVSGAGNAQLFVADSRAAAYGRILVGNDQLYSPNTLELVFGGSSMGAFFTGGLAGQAAHIGTDGNFSMDFGTNGTHRMTILKTGEVGIGTKTPANSLVIISTSTTYNPVLGQPNGNLSIADGTDVFGLQLGIVSSSGLGYIQSGRHDGTATAYQLALNPEGGNVSIGTKTGTQLYYCDGGANAGLMGRGNSGPCSGGTWQATGIYIP